MNRMRPSIQSLSRSACAGAFFGCVSVCLWLNAALLASEPPPGIPPGKAIAMGTNSGAGTNAVPNLAQPAANRLDAVPITNTAAAATNLSEAVATNSAAVLDDKHKLTIGDRLSFRIVEDEEDPKPLFVTDSGDLEVPYIGRVPAENKTCRQLAAEIKTELEKEYYYQATVIIAVDLMTKSHGRVYLVGAVRLPGPVDLPGDEVLTLSKAILRAGGQSHGHSVEYRRRQRFENAGNGWSPERGGQFHQLVHFKTSPGGSFRSHPGPRVPSSREFAGAASERHTPPNRMASAARLICPKAGAQRDDASRHAKPPEVELAHAKMRGHRDRLPVVGAESRIEPRGRGIR